MIFSVFVSSPKGLEYLLEDELRSYGLNVTAVSPQGVYGEASLAIVYTMCLWSRLANRVQLILFTGPAENQTMLYQLCHQFPWDTLFTADKTLAIEFHGSSTAIRNSMFGGQVIKDAIVDYFREKHDQRPMIDRENPHIRLHAYLKHDTLTVSFDVTGYSMHQRGYRTEAGIAPLKENMASALLMRAKWPAIAAAFGSLQDPFCGSGTLVIEAAMMAANVAPGLLRDDQSVHYWEQHDATLWEQLREQARLQITAPKITLSGSDSDEGAIRMARANAQRAGVAQWVNFKACALDNAKPQSEAPGLLISNPPYGERLGDTTQLMPVYKTLGTVLHTHYQGWQAAIITSDPQLAKAIGLRANKQYTVYNGALECKLYCIDLSTQNHLWHSETKPLSAGAQMLANRLLKNHAHLQKWAKRQNIQCYRLYDADLPEYAYAIDIYNDHAVLQEYAAPKTIDPKIAKKHSLDVLQVVPTVLGFAPDHVILKERKQQKGTNQYQKMNHTRRFIPVSEGQAVYNVNLHDYLDTGLFLDHRLLRLQFAKLKPGTRFLNCFCYTATASVQAALAGALTTNIDLSNTYLQWAEDNFRLNQLPLSRHQFIPYDCREWLNITRDRFDVIFLDPPSFSNSKRMTDTLDIQRDHEPLISSAMRLLTPGGTLYFSTNFRQFKLSPNVATQFKVQDMTDATIDVDFKRNKRIHQCFKITQI